IRLPSFHVRKPVQLSMTAKRLAAINPNIQGVFSNMDTPTSSPPRRPARSGAASRILEELTSSINRSADPPKMFYAILHYVAATAALPDDVKARIFDKLAAEWRIL